MADIRNFYVKQSLLGTTSIAWKPVHSCENYVVICIVRRRVLIGYDHSYVSSCLSELS